MSWDKIKIECQCWEFNHSLTFNERSIFNKHSNVNPIKWKVGNLINLMDFAISVSPIRYSAMKSESYGNYNSLVQEVGDMTLQLSGIKDNKFLVNYFRLFDITGVVAYRQYIVDVKYDNVIVFSGYINQDNLNIEYKPAIESDVIEIQILGIEKEFIRYFDTADIDSNHTASMKYYKDIFNNGYNGASFQCPWHLWDWIPPEEDPESEFAGVPSVIFKAMTSLSEVTASSSIEKIGGNPMVNWFINCIPQFFKDNHSNEWWIRSGYKRFWQKEVSTYYFIDKVCISMGWAWQIKVTNGTGGEYKFILANRSEFAGTVIEIEYSKLKNLKLGYQLAKTDIDYIVIPAGYVTTSHYHSQGKPVKLISLKETFINNSQFFGYFIGDPNGYNLYKGSPPSHYVYENAQGNKRYDIREFWYSAEGGNWGDGLNQKDYKIKSDKILMLDGGDHDGHCTLVNTSHGWNKNTCDIGALGTDWGILFRGNAGDCCFKASYSNQNILLQDYNSYSQTEQFKNNYISLLGGNNTQTIEAEIYELIFDPLSAIKFINSGQEFFNYKFAINELEVDMINETTKIVAVREV